MKELARFNPSEGISHPASRLCIMDVFVFFLDGGFNPSEGISHPARFHCDFLKKVVSGVSIPQKGLIILQVRFQNCFDSTSISFNPSEGINHPARYGFIAFFLLATVSIPQKGLVILQVFPVPCLLSPACFNPSEGISHPASDWVINEVAPAFLVSIPQKGLVILQVKLWSEQSLNAQFQSLRRD